MESSQPRNFLSVTSPAARRLAKEPASNPGPASSGLTDSIFRNFLRVFLRSVARLIFLLFSVRQRSEPQQRINIAQDFGSLTRKRNSRCGGRSQLPSHN